MSKIGFKLGSILSRKELQGAVPNERLLWEEESRNKEVILRKKRIGYGKVTFL